MTYEEVLDYMYSQLPMYQKQGKSAFKKDLSNTLTLCNALDNPQEKFKSVHLAGTNGKGSTAHSIASVLQEAGYKVGLYTSPHLKDYRERIKVNGNMISEEAVVSFVDRIDETIKTIEPSFFEITVAMAFDYFASEQVDIAVIETGLGGRLDSTNIITPLLSVITSIGMDHMNMLGDTLELIAGEKAGIIKKGVPVILPQNLSKSVETVFLNKANSMQSAVNVNSNYYRFSKLEDGVNVYFEEAILINNLQPEIKGQFYLKNLPTIIGLVKELNKAGYSIDKEHLIQGIEKAVSNTGLKGRWQKLNKTPEIIADIGHNVDGWNEILKQLNFIKFGRLHIVLGLVSDKNIKEIFDLLPTDAIYYLCEPKIPRAMPVEKLAECARLSGFTYTVCKDVNESIEKAKRFALEQDFIFVGGSTFVVAEIKEL